MTILHYQRNLCGGYVRKSDALLEDIDEQRTTPVDMSSSSGHVITACPPTTKRQRSSCSSGPGDDTMEVDDCISSSSSFVSDQSETLICPDEDEVLIQVR